MTGFEPRASSIGSDRSANWTTTTALLLIFIVTVSSVDVILLIMNVLCKISWWLDSKTNPLVSKVTTLPSVPHPLAIKFSFFISVPSLTIAVGSLMEDQLVGNVCFVTNRIYVVIVLSFKGISYEFRWQTIWQNFYALKTDLSVSGVYLMH